MPALVDKAKARLRAFRARWPVLDHAVRAYEHATAALWGQQAAAITYFGFLSVFPLLAVAFAVVARLAAVYPRIRDQVEQAISDALPGLIGRGDNQLDLDAIAGAGTSAGIVGLLAFVWTGTGAMDALRDGIRVIFGTTSAQLSLPTKKVRDVGLLLTVGTLAVTSVALSTVTTQATSQLLGLVDLDESGAARGLLRLLSIGVALAINTLILSILFRVMSVRSPSWAEVWSGALIGAVLLEVLKLLVTRLLESAFTNPLYAGFAVAVGLLLWINASARVVMLAAAWVATEPSVLAADPDVEAVSPSGLPMLVTPEVPAPPGTRRALPGATAVVLGLVALAYARRRFR